RSAQLARLLPAVYDELRAVAEAHLRRRGRGFTLHPTDVVHEACVHLMQHGHGEWTSTGHFRAIAARKIWQVIVDHIKRRYAQKRGGRPRSAVLGGRGSEDGADAAPAPRRRVSIDQISVVWHDRAVDLLDLADALAALEQESRRLHETVMLHWFGGLSHAEVAEQIGVSRSTAEKDFRYALAWLNRRLQDGSTRGD
ncbi:MAG: sigma-70 family RNA polymerase sigma factor, partial [Planctomycetota bacterium]